MNDPFPAESARRNADLTSRLLLLGMNRRIPLTVLLAALGGTMNTPTTCARAESSPASPASPAHKELGAIRWSRDFNAALAESKATGKPLLILFDEVPGCHTCVSFGETVLSHPLIVEAAEDLFVPVAVFNNIEGADRAVLKSFNEPEWNNPVVRIVDAQRTELVPRVDGDYTAHGIVSAMAAALKKSGREAPGYLSLLAQEVDHAPKEKAVFSMHCFWEGEAKLGGIEGVLATRTGFADGKEVVEVTFDPDRLKSATLLSRARDMACIVDRAGADLKPSAKDDKYQLRGTAFESLPMTPAQATRMNAALGDADAAKRILSPRQLALLESIKSAPNVKWPSAIGRDDLAAAWRDARAVGR